MGNGPFPVAIVDYGTGDELEVKAYSRTAALEEVYGSEDLETTTEHSNPVYASRYGLMLGYAYFC